MPLFELTRGHVTKVLSAEQITEQFVNLSRSKRDKAIGLFHAVGEFQEGGVTGLVMAGMYGYGSAREMIESVTDVATQIYADPADRRLTASCFLGITS